ncbi:MAG: phosphoribosylglycinamide formyltransferase [Deltaproteobacteria bacterium]|jgi:phosphoribosylglycinamide formyltransferase-1|nr:phosphoribosylglycinamide formyltransferase [Deltaproteobacteria bacterium]
MKEKIRIGALISGGGSNLQAIMNSCENAQISAKVTFVGSDNPRSEGLKRAAASHIPAFVVDYTSIIQEVKADPAAKALPADFDYEDILAKQTLVQGWHDDDKIRFFLFSRAIAEAQLLAELAKYSYDLLVLAGFMRTLTPYFIDRVNPDRHNPRIMNIHPALLPAFPGTDGYGDTYRYGCKVAGCSVHFIDYGEDTGPIIGQRAFAISPGDSLESIREKGLKLEWQLYPECIQLFAEGRLKTVKKTFTLPNGQQRQRTIVEILPEPS